jgi:hypothetical protein
MGPQGSGKSTIAKIISYCTWVEKRRMLDGFFRENFLERLKSFHNLGDVYFPANAYFKYDGDCCNIEFANGEESILVKGNIEFKKRKQIYIPAERNFAASIPHLGRYKETNNNVLDFLYYWYEAKKHYSKDNTLNIPELGVSFYYVEQDDRDVVVLISGEEIILQNTSSGVQSMLPLYLLMDYLTNIIYREEVVLSPFEKGNVERQKKDTPPPTPVGYDPNGEPIYEITVTVTFYEQVFYKYSQFIIEEPEQNLFPTTQCDLIYYMLRVMNESGRDHRLTFTTHSPYILYALNNCMMGYLVKDNMPEDEREELSSKNSWIDPNLVSIWELVEEKGGSTIRSIKNSETGTVSKHYFNGVMNDVMKEYRDMLTYFKPE